MLRFLSYKRNSFYIAKIKSSIISKDQLIRFTDKGLYVQRADVYIDPHKRVNRALVTHGHADHARWGNKHYLCTDSAKPVIRHRLGKKLKIESIAYGKVVKINGVKFSFHPAGHITGSAQIRVEYKGEVWVVSGDYKIEDDGLAEKFESVKCDTFVTEATFALPIYKWTPQEEIFEDINDWWRQNKTEGITSLLTGYSLGKAQRLIQGLDPSIGKIFTHKAVEDTNAIFRKQGIKLHDTIKIAAHQTKKMYTGNIVICPPGAVGNAWATKLGEKSVASASGWMAIRNGRKRRSCDRGFVLSDHADWEGLVYAVKETEANRVFVTHGAAGSCAIFAKWLCDQGLDAAEVKVEKEKDSDNMII